jgi:hypothetical protein
MQTRYLQGITNILCSTKPQKQTQFKAKTNPITERVKLMQSVYLERIMKKNAIKGHEKTKPKQTQNKACPERSRMGQFFTA